MLETNIAELQYISKIQSVKNMMYGQKQIKGILKFDVFLLIIDKKTN